MFSRTFKILALMAVLVTAAGLAFGAQPKPEGANGAGSYSELRYASPFSYGFVCQETVQWIPFAIGNVVVASSGDIISTLDSMGTGTASIVEVNTSEAGGFLLDADTDSVSWLWMIPGDIDLAQPIYISVLFSESSTTTGTVGMVFTYGAMTVGTTAIAVAATNTGVTDDTSTATSATAHALQWLDESTITASTWSGTPGQDFVLMKGVFTQTTVADMTVYGAKIRYKRKFVGCGM